MTLPKPITTSLLAVLMAAVITLLAGLNRYHVEAAVTMPQPALPAPCAELPAYQPHESPEQWLQREVCRQQQQTTEQVAAWKQDPMGGVVWEE